MGFLITPWEAGVRGAAQPIHARSVKSDAGRCVPAEACPRAAQKRGPVGRAEEEELLVWFPYSVREGQGLTAITR
jgi:hypothetical protein